MLYPKVSHTGMIALMRNAAVESKERGKDE
jgi:hypothetical protein